MLAPYGDFLCPTIRWFGFEPLAATIEAMLADEAAYAAHQVHFGGPPQG